VPASSYNRPLPGFGMNSSAALRILDANANRAREALRVVEDYARFVLDDDLLSQQLKQLRHDLTQQLGQYVGTAIVHRDTPGDVGTDNKVPAEGVRHGLADVVIASGKRLGEALRVIEEVLKTERPSEGFLIESLRYQWYGLEQTIALSFRPNRFRNVRLYVLITEAVCKRPWLDAAEQAILGGADCIQLREKELEAGELLGRAQQLVSLCRSHRVPCIINDRPDVAVLARADGVHVGQGDLSPADVRKIVGEEMLIGVSTHNLDQARRAVREGADYIGVGPVFKSGTKTREFIAGLDYAKQVAEQISAIPVVAIAGITEQNVDEVLATGIRAVAVTAAVAGSDDPQSAAKRIKKKLVHEMNTNAHA